MHDAIPERPEDEDKENELDQGDNNEPVKGHDDAHDGKEHLGIVAVLLGEFLRPIDWLTFLLGLPGRYEDTISHEEHSYIEE